MSMEHKWNNINRGEVKYLEKNHKFENKSRTDWSQFIPGTLYRGVDKSLARPGRKQVAETEDFDVHMSFL